MRQLAILLLCTLVHISAFAAEWTVEEKKWFVASSVFIITDWGTTRNLSKRYDEGYHEKNKVLGRYPSINRINNHFISVLVLNYVVADALFPSHRLNYLKTVTFFQAGVTAHNLSIGLKIDF